MASSTFQSNSVNSNSTSNLGSTMVFKQEKNEVKNQMMSQPSSSKEVLLMTTQESQKDFLFDPYAAAYYERFEGFVPGEKILNFKDLKWPALQSNDRYKQSRRGRTYYEEYLDIYGECKEKQDQKKMAQNAAAGQNVPLSALDSSMDKGRRTQQNQRAQVAHQPAEMQRQAPVSGNLEQGKPEQSFLHPESGRNLNMLPFANQLHSKQPEQFNSPEMP